MENAKVKPRPAPRDRELPIMVYVNPEERAAIKGGAEAAGMSASAYLRALGTGYRPRAAPDVKAIDRLAAANAGAGRLMRALAGRVTPEIIRQVEEVQMMLAEAVREVNPR